MVKLFGKSYTDIGDTSSDLLLKCRGDIKIQWGNKFIDLIKNGRINTEIPDIIQIVPNKDSINANGIYYLQDTGSIVIAIGDNIIPITGNDLGIIYVSYLEQSDISGEEKYQALKNIGFIYSTIEEATLNPITNGVIYIEKEQKLYLVLSGKLVEYNPIRGVISNQVIIDKDNNDQGALIIKGEGKNNSLIVGNIYIYSSGENNYIESSEGSIIIKSLGNDKIVISDKIYLNSDTKVFDLTCNRVLASDGTFELYSLNGESYLKVNNIIGNKTNYKYIYPIYWFENNNILTTSTLTDDTSFKLNLLYKNTYQVDDILATYVYIESVKELIQVQLQVIEVSTTDNAIFCEILNKSEIGDDTTILTLLTNQILFLTSKKDPINILSIGKNIYYSGISEVPQVVIGNLKELKDYLLQLGLEISEEELQGIFTKFFISEVSYLINPIIYSPIIKSDSTGQLARYDDSIDIPVDDNSNTLVTSKWVRQLVESMLNSNT